MNGRSNATDFARDDDVELDAREEARVLRPQPCASGGLATVPPF